MKYIKVKTQFEAQHQWKKAPEQVKFLRSLHRHIFYVSAKIEVEHNDRALEFFMVKKKIDQIIFEILLKKGKNKIVQSCEDSAEVILDYLEIYYPKRRIEVVVSEDHENEAGVNNHDNFLII
jgi:hypothetical protein